ncbi:MAG: hypothetical protein AB1749_10770 [Pseudomonadota bacterium]
MQHSLRCLVSSLAALSLVSASVQPLFAAPVMTRADYEACQAQDEAAFRTAIEAITVKALNHGLAGFDYRSVVAEEWKKGGLDAIIDARVDLAVAEVRSETSWGSLIQSLGSKDKAQELATAVAERVYKSEAVTSAIESLAVGVGNRVGGAIETAARDAAGPTLTCLQAFLGPRYGSTVSRVVAGDAGRELGLDLAKGSVDIGAGDIIRQSGGGITGAALLLMRRQLANMTTRIGQRMVGSILSRLVSVVAGGIGVVLIAKDFWDLRHGVLPIVADEMKSKTSKDMVQDELAKGIAEQIGEHVREIGAKSAERIVEIWHEFRAAHAKALEVAERSDRFKRYLDGVSADRLGRLDEVVAIALAGEGETGLMKRLEDGSLDEAVVRLAPAGMEIARETRSLADGLAWAAVAGDRLPEVVELGLYRRAKASDFTRASLTRLLGLGDRLSAQRLASISRETRDTLLDLDDRELKGLARGLGESELSTLARYLTGLGKAPRERVLLAVANDPGKMQLLSADRVRAAIVTSRDQSAAVEMMLRDDGLIDPLAAAADMRLAWDGRISPLLIWEKHPVAVVGLGLAALVLLAMLRRLLRPRRRAAPSNPS